MGHVTFWIVGIYMSSNINYYYYTKGNT